MTKESRIQNRAQLQGHDLWLDGAWRTVANVAGPKHSQFGAAGRFYRVQLVGGYQDGSGRIYPDWLHVWRGDILKTRRTPEKA